MMVLLVETYIYLT